MVEGGVIPVAKRVFDISAVFGGKKYAGMHAVIRQIDGGRMGRRSLRIYCGGATARQQRQDRQQKPSHHHFKPISLSSMTTAPRGAAAGDHPSLKFIISPRGDKGHSALT